MDVGKVQEDFLHFPLGQVALTGVMIFWPIIPYDDCVLSRQSEKKNKKMRLATIFIILTPFNCMFFLSPPIWGTGLGAGFHF